MEKASVLPSAASRVTKTSMPPESVSCPFSGDFNSVGPAKNDTFGVALDGDNTLIWNSRRRAGARPDPPHRALKWVETRESVPGPDPEDSPGVQDETVDIRVRKCTVGSATRDVCPDSATFGEAPRSAERRLGGFLRLSGLAPGAISGPHTLFGAATVYRQIAAPAFFTFD